MRGYFAIGIENTKDTFNVGSLWRTADLFGAAFIFFAAAVKRWLRLDELATKGPRR